MSNNNQIPQEKCIDHTLLLSQEGYLFIKNRVNQYQSDLFQTRLLGKKVICMSGMDAARIFYNVELFERKDALPKHVLKTLFGVNAIQTMDGEKHLHRKMLFMSVFSEERQQQLSEIAKKYWNNAINRWGERERIVLFDEVNYILCQSVCEWAGVPLHQSEVKTRANEFIAMVNDLAAIGPRYWKGKKARSNAEKWLKGIIEDVRSGKRQVKKNSILYEVATYKETDGSLLDAQMAAIELINILRPTVAVSRFIVFMALALYEHSEYKEKLRSGNENDRLMFVQEVRRYYPFTPFLGAIVKKNFIWHKCKFKKGTLVILDVYGINHDPRIWKNPEKFRPERFQEREDNLFDFIPQGGGDPTKGHRCPGEGVTIELMKLSLDFLVNQMEYKLPDQDFSYSLSQIPTLPKNGFIMSGIKKKCKSQSK